MPLPLEVDLYNQSNYGVISIYHITINTLTSVKLSTVTYDKPGFETNILVFLGPTFQVSPQCSTPPSSSLDHRPGPTPTTTPAKLHPGNAYSIGRTTETCGNQWNTIEQQQRKNKKWKLVLETQCLFFWARIQANKKCGWVCVSIIYAPIMNNYRTQSVGEMTTLCIKSNSSSPGKNIIFFPSSASAMG